MATGRRGERRWLARAIAALGLLAAAGRAPAQAGNPAAPPAAAVPAASFQLAGTWHVLVHYRDASSANPEAWHWDDRVWIFEPGPAGLRWTEYPIVVFHDDSGRFESLGSVRQARVLAAWEPNESQRAQIRAGLEVNPRGRNSKQLHGSDAEGWRSGDRLRSGASQVVSYAEDWSVEGLPASPVFTQTDMLGDGELTSLEGVTRYATQQISPGGDELRGSFVRDGSRTGDFQLRRAGPVKSVGEHSQQEIRQRLGVPQP